MASSRQIEQTAATWLARRDAGAWSPAEQAALEAWLAESTAHRVAFVRLEAAWQRADRLKVLGAGRATGVVPPRGAWVLSPFVERRHTTPAAPAPARPRRVAAAPRGRGRNWPLLAATACLALLGVLLFGWQRYAAVDQASYATAIGSLREVALADGSRITLSSDSRVRVSLSRGRRDVELQRGEAFFEVAKDHARPFTVAADGRRVTAVGTRFDVRREDADLRVVVTQGLVRLETDTPADGRRQPVTLLPAGSIALASAGGITVQTGSLQQAERYLSWRDGFLSFHDTPLAAAAAEFNRYNQRKIVIADAATAGLRVGGSFRWSNADAFVRLLQQGFPLRVEQRAGTIVLRHR